MTVNLGALWCKNETIGMYSETKGFTLWVRDHGEMIFLLFISHVLHIMLFIEIGIVSQ